MDDDWSVAREWGSKKMATSTQRSSDILPQLQLGIPADAALPAYLYIEGVQIGWWLVKQQRE